MPLSTWDPTAKDRSILLKDGNRNAYGAQANAAVAVLGTKQHSAGKKYFEVYAESTTNGTLVGIFDVGAATYNTLYAALGSPSATGCVSLHQDGRVFPGGLSSGSGFWVGGVVGVAVDIDAGLVWFSVNNVWQASGNPASGTSPLASVGSFVSIAPISSKGSSATTGHVLRSNVNQCQYSPPAGFSYWEETTTIGNNAKDSSGAAVAEVLVYERPSGVLLAKITPDVDGDWSADVPDGEYGVLYLADGDYPVYHGTYAVGP